MSSSSNFKKYASAFEEDNERMDIIGQNGNDGLHYDITDQDLIDNDSVEPLEENDPNPQPTARGGIRTK